jgi:hypothetical protein
MEKYWISGGVGDEFKAGMRPKLGSFTIRPRKTSVHGIMSSEQSHGALVAPLARQSYLILFQQQFASCRAFSTHGDTCQAAAHEMR